MAFSDWRIHDVESPLMAAQKIKPDLIIYAGDDVARFGPEQNSGRNIFSEMAKHSKHGVFAIIGNDCSKENKKILKAPRVYDLHRAPRTIESTGFVGLEGATREISNPVGYVLYSGKEIKRHLYSAFKKISKSKKIILVSHNPPSGVLDLACRFGVDHIGSKEIRSFILRNKQVIINVCGHVHSRGGQSEYLGKCLVINAANHDGEGAEERIAVIDTGKEKISLEWYKDEIMSLPQVGAKRRRHFLRAGFYTISDIEKSTDARLECLPGVGKWHIARWRNKIKAIKTGKPIVLTKLLLPPNCIYCDIETDLPQSIVWLIGIYNPKNSEFRQFFAKNAAGEKRMLKDFCHYMEKNDIQSIISFSGCKFEERVLKNRLRECKLSKYRKLINDTDIGTWVQNNVFCTASSYKLKDLASVLGYGFKHKEISGYDVGVFYMAYLAKEKTHFTMAEILAYNRDDVMSLPFLVDRINKIFAESKPPVAPSSTSFQQKLFS